MKTCRGLRLSKEFKEFLLEGVGILLVGLPLGFAFVFPFITMIQGYQTTQEGWDMGKYYRVFVVCEGETVYRRLVTWHEETEDGNQTTLNMITWDRAQADQGLDGRSVNYQFDNDKCFVAIER